MLVPCSAMKKALKKIQIPGGRFRICRRANPKAPMPILQAYVTVSQRLFAKGIQVPPEHVKAGVEEYLKLGAQDFSDGGPTVDRANGPMGIRCPVLNASFVIVCASGAIEKV